MYGVENNSTGNVMYILLRFKIVECVNDKLFVMFPSQTVLDLARRNTNELVTSSINFKI